VIPNRKKNAAESSELLSWHIEIGRMKFDQFYFTRQDGFIWRASKKRYHTIAVIGKVQPVNEKRGMMRE